MLSSEMVTASCNIVAMAKSEAARSDAATEAVPQDESQAEIELGARIGHEAEAEKALPLGPQQLPELLESREIDDAATMKALADPLRMKILRVMAKHAHVEPRIMTVKQIAEEIGEPTTKLYRHMKQLLAVGLIQVAELRLVGGIVEQRYRVAQKDLTLHPQRMGTERVALLSEELSNVAGAAIDDYFVRYEEALNSGRTHLLPQDSLDNPPHVRSVGVISDCRIPQAKAAELAERLHALVQEFTHEPHYEGPDTVNVNLLAICYATEAEG